MKSRGIILLVIMVIGIALLILGQKDKTPQKYRAIVGLKVPEFSLFDEKGERVASSQLSGKTLFVHFWASWCKECRVEMPGIQALFDRKQSDPNFVFLGVLYREDPKVSRKWLSDNNYNLPIFIDVKENAAKVFGVTAVPETFILAPDGILTRRIIGPADWDKI